MASFWTAESESYDRKYSDRTCCAGFWRTSARMPGKMALVAIAILSQRRWRLRRADSSSPVGINLAASEPIPTRALLFRWRADVLLTRRMRPGVSTDSAVVYRARAGGGDVCGRSAQTSSPRRSATTCLSMMSIHPAKSSAAIHLRQRRISRMWSLVNQPAEPNSAAS